MSYLLAASNSCSTILLYSSKPPSILLTEPPPHTHSSLHTIRINLSSWETKITPPLYLLIAFPNASIVSISRWLVGSSRTRKLGVPMHILAKATLDFCPPDRLPTVCKARSPDTPKLPSCLLYSSMGLPTIPR